MWELLTPLTGLFENHWWKAFFSLCIPIGQFVWTRYGRPGSDFRKRQLRMKIADLGAQRESLKKYSDVRHSDQALADLDAELEACMVQLVAVSRRAMPTAAAAGDAPGRSRRRPLSRALLAYVPSGPLAWLLHSAFYVIVLMLVLGLIGVLSSGEDVGYGLLGLAFFAIPALVIRHFARRLDERAPPTPATPSPAVGS